jgi:pyruvate dehydrogenase E1 component alpha subunit
MNAAQERNGGERMTADVHTLLGIFETMATINAADEKMRSLIMSGQAFLAYYSPRGQEGISAAVSADLRPDDQVVTTYRGIHDHIAKGIPLPQLFAEFLGRVDGTCKGKGGGMHITHPESGVMVTTGVVGSGLPIANGLGLAAQYRGTDQVVVCNFGDGASNIGAFHEALNLAGLWKLPVVFVCQNNGYAEHTRYAKGTSVGNVAERAAGYKITGLTVDGNDPVATYGAAAEAIRAARAGEGPTLLEATTYRFFGHYFGEDLHYQPAAEREAAMAADPSVRFRARLISEFGASEDDLTAIEKRATEAVEDAMQIALASPFPDPESILTDVYAKGEPR